MAHLHVHQVSPICAGIHQHPLSEVPTLLLSACAFSPDISSLHIKTKCLFSQGLATLLSSAVAPPCAQPRCASTVMLQNWEWGRRQRHRCQVRKDFAPDMPLQIHRRTRA